MSKLFLKLGENRKKLNKDINNGIASVMLPQAAEKLHGLFVTGMKGMTSGVDFQYLGYRKLTPLEDYNNQFAISTNRESVDISKSTLYKVEYLFKLNGEEIRRVLSLPYVEKGGILYLSDAAYVITPVLTDYVISSDGNAVFTRLLKDKLLYKKIEKNVLVNGVKKPLPIVITRLYKFIKNNINDKIPIALMLFIKYGFKETFKHYFNINVDIIHDENIDFKKYTDKTVYSSLSIKPRTLQDDNYRPHNLHIIADTTTPSKFLDTMVNSLIYSFDLINVYSRNIVDILKDPDNNSELMFWKILLGKVIFKNTYTIDKIISSIDEYISVVDSYVDPSISKKLLENNLHIGDFYDLLAHVMDNFDTIVHDSDKRSSSIGSRYIDINYYILYYIIEGINKALYGINKEFIKKDITVKDVNKIFNKHLSSKKIYSLISSKGTNVSLVALDYSGDNYASKITATLTLQNQGNGVLRSKNNVFPKNTRTIHGEDLHIGTVFNLPKKSPSAIFRINHYSDIDLNTGRFIVSDKKLKQLDKIDTMLTDKFIDTDIGSKEYLDTELMESSSDY